MDYLLRTENIRNICILAHVDHGKTTIADSLIASNGIISTRMAGKMRYMDSRQDEQERGITMKSSSIALKFSSDDQQNKYLVNLIDTPGHVDFAGEVSAAIRLCDGALVVVDVVEGVCSQTKTAIEQAWKEGIEPILVLNKIDRLVLEHKLDETAAYLRLNQLVEQVNAIVATLLTTEIFEDETLTRFKISRSRTTSKTEPPEDHQAKEPTAPQSDNATNVYDWANAIEDIDDDKFYFMPEKNNVIFASAIDDWAFTIDDFARILSSLHKINLTALQRTLWGDFCVDMKQKRIVKHAQAKSKKNLFTTMILENIWKIYDTICIRRDKIKLAKICDVIGVPLSARDLDHKDPRHQIKTLMGKWLPLAKNILKPVSEIVPNPRELSERRVERLLSSHNRRFDEFPKETTDLKDVFMNCSMDGDASKIAFISKMIPYPCKNLPEYRRVMPARAPRTTENGQSGGVASNDVQQEVDENAHTFIAFARIFSGKLEKGDELYVLGPKHDPSEVAKVSTMLVDKTKNLENLDADEHVTIAQVDSIYLFMGRDLEPINSAWPGNIVGIRGLERHLVRTATLSSTLYCPPFNDLHLPAAPILRVAIEPKNPTDMASLIKGLKLLNQADPCVDIKIQDTGEHVIIATGEVHLQRCLKDLEERYTNEGIEFNVSQPIVPFRETIVLPPKTDMVNELIDESNVSSKLASKAKLTDKTKSAAPSANRIYEATTLGGKCHLKLVAMPLPNQVVKCLAENVELFKIVSKTQASWQKSLASKDFDDTINKSIVERVKSFKSSFERSFEEAIEENSEWAIEYPSLNAVFDRIWSFGPKYCGQNLLIQDAGCSSIDYSAWRCLQSDSDSAKSLDNYVDAFISGFQLATNAGPLCEEPMLGVCFKIIDWTIESNEVIAGQLIPIIKEACRKAFQLQPQRLMSPMFSCDIQIPSEALGKMYAVLGRRNGRILHGDSKEGSQTFEIRAYIPVIESLDFAAEIRKQTSGLANPQLIFSHFEVIEVDPFWTPTTEEEYLLYGDKADTDNLARKYLNLVRRRKGLSVQEKIVEHGEKQRTIKRNK